MKTPRQKATKPKCRIMTWGELAEKFRATIAKKRKAGTKK
jgi:hypothetical protein